MNIPFHVYVVVSVELFLFSFFFFCAAVCLQFTYASNIGSDDDLQEGENRLLNSRMCADESKSAVKKRRRKKRNSRITIAKCTDTVRHRHDDAYHFIFE